MNLCYNTKFNRMQMRTVIFPNSIEIDNISIPRLQHKSICIDPHNFWTVY